MQSKARIQWNASRQISDFDRESRAIWKAHVVAIQLFYITIIYHLKMETLKFRPQISQNPYLDRWIQRISVFRTTLAAEIPIGLALRVFRATSLPLQVRFYAQQCFLSSSSRTKQGIRCACP
jgi:hypothetical protein